MVALRYIKIAFENPNAVYVPGDYVTGHVVMSLAEGIQMRGISLKLKCKAKVEWGQGRQRRSGKEIYFNQLLPLVPDAGTNLSLGPGDHTFPFSVQLPQGLPSSFEGEYGRIAYTCKARVSIPWGYDFRSSVLFKVFAPVDLNRISNARNPVAANKEEDLFCSYLCFNRGKISVAVTLDRAGYIPGETIHINAEVKNMSSTAIVETKASLHMITNFTAAGWANTKTVEKDVAMVNQGPISAGSTDVWNAVPLTIPSLLSANLDNCRSIQAYYGVKFLVVTNQCASNISLYLPITLGTIPFASTSYSQGIYSSHSWQEIVPSQVQLSTPSRTDYPTIPSPSYNEAAWTKPIYAGGQDSRV